MKILFGMPEKTARGGINNCEPPFIRELAAREIAVSEKIYSFDNAPKISNIQRIANVLKTARQWRQITAKESYDLIHINTAFDRNAVLRDAFVLSSLKNGRAKIFLKFHGSDAALLETKSPILQSAWRKTIEKSVAVGVLSAEEKENFVRAGVAANKIFVVKNTVAVQDEPPARRFGNQPFRLLFLARLIESKGLLETVNACRILRGKRINFHLDVLGEGIAREKAEKIARGANLSASITFHGHVAENRVREFYRKSDALVFPTYHQEGFPMVVFDALAHGLPVITTRIRAAADYLKAGENCFFCEPKNPADVAAKIETLALDSDLRRKMSQSNFALAREFSPEKIAAEYLKIYRQIVNRRAKN